MYTGKQQKEPTSRVIGQPEGKGVQQLRVRDNREKSTLQMKDLIQLQVFDYKSPDPNKYCKVETIPKNGKAYRVKANMKGACGDFNGGTPSVCIVGWGMLTSNARKTDWVRFHIWNQLLGGPGSDLGNLIPTNKETNNGQEWSRYEKAFKEAAPNGIEFDVTVNDYYNDGQIETGFPQGLTGWYKSENQEKEINLIIEKPKPEDLYNITTVQSQYIDALSIIPTKNKLEIKNLKKKYLNRPWTEDEDAHLFELVFFYGDKNWCEIAKHVDLRTSSKCYHRWTRCLNPELSKESWTKEEEKDLINLVNQCGDKDWTMIAKLKGNRNDVQCRYRYNLLRKQPHPADL